MKPSGKKKKLLAIALCGMALALPCVANAAEAKLDPPGSVLAENGEAAYIVSELVITGNKKHTEEEIRRLVPEATRGLVRPGRLSKQLSLLNDGQVMKIESALTPVGDREYRLTLTVEEVKNDRFAISLNNTGNEYTGDCRLGINWLNTDITKNGDALGLAYITSPDKHIDDVVQAALSYKAIFPNSGDSMYFAYSYSDVDMGRIPIAPGFGIDATGQGHTASLHYQRNMRYSKARRQTLDLGFDFKHYKNDQNWLGTPLVNTNYDVGTFSATYYDVTRKDNNAFSWNVGWTTNLIGNREDYNAVRANTDKNFNILHFGAGYQHKTKTDWLLGIRAYGQWTPNDLVQSEQLGGGGFGSVRGFEERVATGDKGIGGSLEIYTPKVLPDSRFVLFFDAAYLSNNTVNLGEVGHRNLASFGIGYRYGSEKLGLYASLDYAKPVSYGGLRGSTRPWTFTLTKTF